MRTLIKDATILNDGLRFRGSLLINGERIEKIFPYHLPSGIDYSDITVIEADGHYLIPGVIDDQVHFREPGLTRKGDIQSESRAAVAGGVTSYMEMPNTDPQSVTIDLLEEKYRRASEVSAANYSFYMGVTNDNLEEVLRTDPKSVCGVKAFLGSSTGNMLVDDQQLLEELFRQTPMLVATHCEDESIIRRNIEVARHKFGEDVPFAWHPVIRNEEACYASSARTVELAEKYGTRLHVLHISTARETQLFSPGHVRDKRITAEVCVHHLWFSDEDYQELGSRIKWNPAIKSAEEREGLWNGVMQERIDIIATDHAPHTLFEKANSYFKAPSGGPLVQHSLVAMLEMTLRRKITPEIVVEKMCHAPANLFRIKERGYLREGYYADMVLVDQGNSFTVTPDNIMYKCGWSPFEGVTFRHSVTHTFVNGELVYENGIINPGVRGKRLLFAPE